MAFAQKPAERKVAGTPAAANRSPFFEIAKKPFQGINLRGISRRARIAALTAVAAAIIIILPKSIRFGENAIARERNSDKKKPNKFYSEPYCQDSFPFYTEEAFSLFIKSCSMEIDLKKLLGNANLAVFGDGSHAEESSKQFIADNVGALKEMGFTHIGLEAFVANEEEEGLINNYLETGEGREKLEKILQGVKCPETADDEMKILDAARENGMKVFGMSPPQLVVGGVKKARTKDERDDYTSKRVAEMYESGKVSRMLIAIGPNHLKEGCLADKITALVPEVEARKVQIIGMEPENIYYLQYENFKLERVIREQEMGEEEFMFSGKSPDGTSEFLLHLPQIEEFSDYKTRCKF